MPHIINCINFPINYNNFIIPSFCLKGMIEESELHFVIICCNFFSNNNNIHLGLTINK